MDLRDLKRQQEAQRASDQMRQDACSRREPLVRSFFEGGAPAIVRLATMRLADAGLEITTALSRTPEIKAAIWLSLGGESHYEEICEFRVTGTQATARACVFPSFSLFSRSKWLARTEWFARWSRDYYNSDKGYYLRSHFVEHPAELIAVPMYWVWRSQDSDDKRECGFFWRRPEDSERIADGLFDLVRGRRPRADFTPQWGKVR